MFCAKEMSRTTNKNKKKVLHNNTVKLGSVTGKETFSADLLLSTEGLRLPVTAQKPSTNRNSAEAPPGLSVMQTPREKGNIPIEIRKVWLQSH